MVFLSDKAGSPYSISSPEAYLSQRSIDRRLRENIQITEQDIPVVDSYVIQVEATGADVFFSSRWMNAVLIQADASQISSVQALGFVESVEFVAPGIQLQGGRLDRTSEKLDLEEDFTETQNDFTSSDEMNAAGYNGSGIRIAVLDAGFPGVNSISAFDEINANGRIVEKIDFIQNSGNVHQYHQHGTMVLSTMAAHKQDEFSGNARGAEYLLYVTEDVASEHRIEEYNLLFAIEKADSAGADIITTSLGYKDFDDPTTDYTSDDMDGETTVAAIAYELGAEKGMLMITSAGNYGPLPSTLTTPADCITCFSIGALTNSGQIGSLSSRGPSADQRIKPDLVAMGIATSVVASDNTIRSVNGTSVSAPQVAGLAAGVWQKYPSMTLAQIMTVLKESASNASDPNNTIGWGIPNFESVVNYIGAIDQEEAVAIFPNPSTQGSIFIQVNDPVEIDEVGYRLVNMRGQLVKEGQMQFNWLNFKRSIPTSDISQGMYIIKVVFKDELIEQRILVR